MLWENQKESSLENKVRNLVGKYKSFFFTAITRLIKRQARRLGLGPPFSHVRKYTLHARIIIKNEDNF